MSDAVVEDAGRKQEANLAPGPPLYRAPRELRAFGRDPLEFLARMQREFGDIVRLNLVLLRMYLVVHPEHVKQVLQERHTNYNKDTFDWRMLKPVVGEGLLTSDGPTWLRQRRLMQPAFHKQRLAALGELMVERTALLSERWEGAARRSETINVTDEMARLTLEIVTRALFGVDVGIRAKDVGESFTILNQSSMEGFSSLLGVVPQLALRLNRKAWAAKRRLDEVVEGIIAERRRDPGTGNDLLSMLLAARDEESGEGMSDQQLRDEVLTLMIAGHETTANALSWTWYLLSQHPEIAAKLRAETAEVLGSRLPAMEDVPHLTYTRMVLDESMRLYPPAWATSRNAVADDELGGYRIEAKSVVFLSPYLTHRHADFWQDPDRFDPERFTPERVAARPRYAYFPFGGGPRLCIGNSFAQSEAVLALATLVPRFELRTQPGYVARPEPLITLRPRGGIPMALRKIQNQA